MAPTLTLAQLRDLGPCNEAMERLAGLLPADTPLTAAAAREAGATFDDIAWAARVVSFYDTDVARRVRMWAADCAARVLPLFEAAFPGDTRPRDAIVAARRQALGDIGNAVKARAWNAAWDAALAPAKAATSNDERLVAANNAAWAATLAASPFGAWEAPRVATLAAVRSSEESWQFDRLVAWLSDDEPESLPLHGIARNFFAAPSCAGEGTE